ncbi:hypothetical protein HDF16_005493, partial [Granulicella aggregans]|nr:hypothetical protein [Granulicella aggregans]
MLKRDDYRCRVPGCSTIKRGKRSVAVHHREPGNSDPVKMLTLCLPCHAKVTRTLFGVDPTLLSPGAICQAVCWSYLSSICVPTDLGP